jgi:phage protein D
MRNTGTQSRLSSYYRVSYPDFPSIEIQPNEVVLHQEMGKHDILELRYTLLTPFILKALKTGTPIQLTWKNDKVSGNFFGYTTIVSLPIKYQDYQETKIQCVGTSYPLKESSFKVWTNKTASQIAIELAKKAKLKPMVTPHKTIFTQQSLSGKSYWEKLNELAETIGYGMQVSGTELHFHPIDKMINQFMTTIPVLYSDNSFVSPFNNFNAPTLDAFEAHIGDYLETSGELKRSTNVVTGVDPVTGKVYSSTTSPNKVGKSIRTTTKDPLFIKNRTNTVVNSSAMAKTLSEAVSHLGRLSIPGKGKAQGDPRIAPWRTVEVQGTQGGGDGFWVIKKAIHSLYISGEYEVEFECRTDGVGGNKPSAFRPSSAGTVPYRNIQNDMIGNSKNKPSVTTLNSSKTLVSQGSSGYKTTPRKWRGN